MSLKKHSPRNAKSGGFQGTQPELCFDFSNPRGIGHCAGTKRAWVVKRPESLGQLGAKNRKGLFSSSTV